MRGRERIESENSEEMPLVTIFGNDLGWALRDAIAYSGSHADIYSRNFDDEERGRKRLNEGGPILLSLFPFVP